MINVRVNGVVWELPDNSTVADLLARRGAPPTGVAVALDGSVVPQASWPNTHLRAGAAVEVVTAVQGG